MVEHGRGPDHLGKILARSPWYYAELMNMDGADPSAPPGIPAGAR
jgi:hypothetical protein